MDTGAIIFLILMILLIIGGIVMMGFGGNYLYNKDKYADKQSTGLVLTSIGGTLTGVSIFMLIMTFIFRV